MAFDKTASEIWRDYVNDGVPGSGDNEPAKQEIRQWGASVESGLVSSKGYNVSTTSQVRALAVPSISQLHYVEIPGRRYRYSESTEMLDNGVSILRPLWIDVNDPGRWVLEPGQFDASFQMTLGAGGDFTSLTEALQFLSGFHPQYVYGRAGAFKRITLRILAGTTLTEGIAAEGGCDLSHILIVSDDAVVPVNFPTDIWWAYAEENSKLPTFGAIFDLQGIGYDGVALKFSSSVVFRYVTDAAPIAGVINAARHNVFINTDCHGSFRKGKFTGAGQNGIHFEKGCRGTAREADVSGCGLNGVYLLSGCVLDAHMIHADHCAGSGLRAEIGSTIAAYGGDVSNCGGVGIYATAGSKIAAASAIMSNMIDLGAYAIGGSDIDVGGAIFTKASTVGRAFLASEGSRMNCQGINLTGIGSTIADFGVLDGSTLNANGTTGTLSQTANAVAANGIIYK